MTVIAWPDVLGRLNRAVREAGGESAFARKYGLPRQDVHEAMKGNRHPGPGMLAAVGVRKVVVTSYEVVAAPVPPAADPSPGTCACPATAERACKNPVCPRQPAHLRKIPNPEAA
ncbi:hypothetical protein VQH23_16135 [Pararoseomonas sp. SCSIO 73927]|uniref:hypothetical protein n=1 Tax=Pararoseomonas sp. SCSIO 73927 TaxID=3114537 RepID=UPI0030CB1621